MKPNNNPLTTYGMVAGVMGQVGCLLLIVILGTLLLGLALDEALGTQPAFVLIMLLASIPMSIATIFLYTRRKAKQLQRVAGTEEENISE